MGKTYPEIGREMAVWVAEQHLFFVASAPLAGDGLVNCSPKGMDSFKILDEHTVAYLDFTGSGAETIAHLRENGRIVIMFCALGGPPKIVRFHGSGRAIEPPDPEFAALRAQFADSIAVRSIILVNVARVSDSCGFAVPKYEYVGERETLAKWTAAKSDEELAAYHTEKNCRSLDGMPALRNFGVVGREGQWNS